MAHAYHAALPGYDPRTILFDGCDECDERAAEPGYAILRLDAGNALRAWQLMRQVKWSGGVYPGRDVSANDYALANELYRVAVFLERAGVGPDVVEAGLRARVGS